jgi:hypothetical protein
MIPIEVIEIEASRAKAKVLENQEISKLTLI